MLIQGWPCALDQHFLRLESKPLTSSHNGVAPRLGGLGLLFLVLLLAHVCVRMVTARLQLSLEGLAWGTAPWLFWAMWKSVHIPRYITRDPPAGPSEFLHSVAVAQTAEVCAKWECLDWNQKKEVMMAMAGVSHPVPVNQSPHLSLPQLEGVPQLLEITESFEAGCKPVGGLCCSPLVGALSPWLMEEVGTLAN